MIRVGIVGSNFGRNVLLPAFRLDPRCNVVALAGTDPARTAALAREADVPHAFGSWRELVASDVDAVAIATPPATQPQVACDALKRGKAVFLEKPLAATWADALPVREQARTSRRPAAIDFEFAELPAWRRAKTLIDDGALGALRHAVVTWTVETYATQMRLKSWKTGGDGGGVLGNLASHTFYYLEYFCGPARNLSARLSGLPGGGGNESTATMTFDFTSGAAGSAFVSQASYLGSGHRVELYGEDGTIALINATADYMRGFELWHARRPAKALERIAVEPEPDAHSDGRIAPVARIVSRFLDAIEGGPPVSPGIEEACRVQQLIETARRSHERRGEAIAVGEVAA